MYWSMSFFFVWCIVPSWTKPPTWFPLRSLQGMPLPPNQTHKTHIEDRRGVHPQHWRGGGRRRRQQDLTSANRPARSNRCPPYTSKRLSGIGAYSRRWRGDISSRSVSHGVLSRSDAHALAVVSSHHCWQTQKRVRRLFQAIRLHQTTWNSWSLWLRSTEHKKNMCRMWKPVRLK